MFIVLGFYKRNPRLSLDEFHAHWRNVHGPLGVNNPVFRKYCRRYVQHHIVPPVGWANVDALDYDGFSESWYDSAESRREMQRQMAQYPEILEDEHKLLDMSKTRILMIDNQVVQLGTDHSLEWMTGQPIP